MLFCQLTCNSLSASYNKSRFLVGFFFDIFWNILKYPYLCVVNLKNMKKFCLGFILLVIISCNKQVDYSKDINELKSQISLLQGQISGLRKTTDSLTNELKGINTQVIEVSRKVDSILNRIIVINTQLIDLNNQLTKNSADVNVLLKKIEDLQIELVNLTKLIQDLKYQQIAPSGYEIVPVDSRLKSNGKGVITIPVVIINYLPETPDGKYLDPFFTQPPMIAWDDAHKYTINRAKEKILKDKIIEKNAIEEGSRYHDYATNTVKPYVNIEVVAYINVKSVNLVKVGTRIVDTTTNDNNDNIDNKVTLNWYNVDFNELFTRIKLQNYIEGLGVKEVWFTSWPKDGGLNGDGAAVALDQNFNFSIIKNLFYNASHRFMNVMNNGRNDNINNVAWNYVKRPIRGNGSWSLMASSYATVRLDPETASLLEWARKKKEEANWGIYKINHHRSKYIFDLFYKKKERKPTINKKGNFSLIRK